MTKYILNWADGTSTGYSEKGDVVTVVLEKCDQCGGILYQCKEFGTYPRAHCEACGKCDRV